MTQREFDLAALTAADIKGEMKKVSAPRCVQTYLRSLICYVLMNARSVIGEDGVLLIECTIGELAKIARCSERTIQRGKKTAASRDWVLISEPGGADNKAHAYTIYLTRFCPPDCIEWIEWTLAHPEEPWKPSADCHPDNSNCHPDKTRCHPDSHPDRWGDTTCNMNQEKHVTCDGFEGDGHAPDAALERPQAEPDWQAAIQEQLAGAKYQAVDQAYDELFGHAQPWEFLTGKHGNDVIRRDCPFVFELLFSHAVQLGWIRSDELTFLRFLGFCHWAANSRKARNPRGLISSAVKAYMRGDRGRMNPDRACLEWARQAAEHLASSGKVVRR